MKDNKLDKEFIDGLYSSRVIISMECGPQTNCYHQVLLTREQFKEVSNAIAKVLGQKEAEKGFNVTVTKDGFALDPEIKTSYTSQEIEKII